MPENVCGLYRLDDECNENNRHFQVIIYEGELAKVKEWVLVKDHIETGGDLFGLWIDKHTAVVQFVLGPGKGCRRTTASFYQDIQYLEEAGKYLTNEHGLCNIGQWHSHHRMSLPRPSGGDENTVWGNMPQLGLNRYIVFIATINGYHSHPQINCFLFERNHEGRQYPVLKGDFQILQAQSPFRLNGAVLEMVKKGEEHESGKTGKTTTAFIVPMKLLIVEAGEKWKHFKTKEEIVLTLIPKPRTIIQAQ